MAITSIRQLAGEVGRSHTAVRRWIRRHDWSFGRPPWPDGCVSDVQLWARRLRRPRKAGRPVSGIRIARGTELHRLYLANARAAATYRQAPEEQRDEAMALWMKAHDAFMAEANKTHSTAGKTGKGSRS